MSIPAQVVLDQVEFKKVYVVNLQIRNIDKLMRRVRFIPPTSSYWSMATLPSVALAPGLDFPIEIRFTMSVDDGIIYYIIL